MPMQLIHRHPRLRVRIGGQELTGVIAARCSFGFDLRVAEAEVHLAGAVPDWVQPWQDVVIEMGATPETTVPRFAGFVAPIRRELWPRGGTISCRGRLVLAELHHNTTEGGTDLSNGGAGQTDEAMVLQVLQQAGLGDYATSATIGGTGRTLGTVAAANAFTWSEGEPALAVIERLDEICLGYRTFESRGGVIYRVPITVIPSTDAAFTFTEGVDIFRATRETDPLPTRNQVRVTGYDAGAGAVSYVATEASLYLPPGVTARPESRQSPMIEFELASDIVGGVGLSCQEVAEWLLGDLNRLSERVELVTYRDDPIGPGQTHQLSASDRLGTNTRYWVQHVDVEIDERNRFRQRIVYVGGSGGDAPETLGPLADFTLLVERESVVVAGAEVLRYVVSCRDTSIGRSAAITARTWTATNGTPDAGSGTTFTTVYAAAPAGEQISLQVTDALSQTHTVTRAVPDVLSESPSVRPLTAAGTARMERYDGATWRTDAEDSGQSVTVAANGPLAGAGTDVLRTADNLQTGALESQPFTGPSATVTALWVETDVDGDRVLAGASDGRVAVSLDGGATWTVMAGPAPGQAVLRCAISRLDADQYWVLTADGLYRSDTGGASWVTDVAAQGGETFRDVAFGHARTLIVMSGGRLAVDRAGTAQTFPVLNPPVTDVVAVAASISDDRFYVYDASGRTFVTSAAGGTTFSQQADLPAADGLVVQPRGLARDGVIPDLLYIAGGAGGVWKSVDGLGSSGGYLRIRQPGVGTAPADAVYTQVGADGLLMQAPIIPTTIVSKPSAQAGPGETIKALNLGGIANSPPAGWDQPGFDDSAWVSAVVANKGPFHTVPPGSSPIWWAATPGNAWDEQCAVRHTFTLPTGVISQVTLEYAADDTYLNITINGVAQSIVPGGRKQVDPDLLLPGQENLIAVRGYTNLPSYGWVAYRLVIT